MRVWVSKLSFLLGVVAIVLFLNWLPEYLSRAGWLAAFVETPVVKVLSVLALVALLVGIGFSAGRDYEWNRQFRAWWERHVSPPR